MCYFNFGLKTSFPGIVSTSQSLFNAHAKLETLLVFWFAFLRKNHQTSELRMRFSTPPTPTLEAQENSITNSQVGHRQILHEECCLFFLPSPPR